MECRAAIVRRLNPASQLASLPSTVGSADHRTSCRPGTGDRTGRIDTSGLPVPACGIEGFWTAHCEPDAGPAKNTAAQSHRHTCQECRRPADHDLPHTLQLIRFRGIRIRWILWTGIRWHQPAWKLSYRKPVDGTRSRSQVQSPHVQIDHCRRETRVTQQTADRQQIDSGLQESGRIRMAKSVRTHIF